jgi:diketogulonate reductase-like aldo/keto reductase
VALRLPKPLSFQSSGVEHLKQMKSYAKVLPVLNQIELHPWLQQRDIVEQCKKDGIVVQA